MQLRWSTPAAQDLYAITRHISRNNRQAARQVAQTLHEGCSRLVQFPELGRRGRIEGTRELIFSGLPYIVVYRVRAETVELLRIYHAAQNWP
jgi:toxin ParE1/3/4